MADDAYCRIIKNMPRVWSLSNEAMAVIEGYNGLSWVAESCIGYVPESKRIPPYVNYSIGKIYENKK